VSGILIHDLKTFRCRIYATYCALFRMFGYRITPCLNEVKRIDPLALFQCYQITHLTKKVLPFTFPKYFVKSGFLGVKSYEVSGRKGRFPFFSLVRSRLIISFTNNKIASLSSLKSIISKPIKNISSLREGSVMILLNKLVESYLHIWSRRMNDFMLRGLMQAAIRGLLPLFNYLNKWDLGNFKDVRKHLGNNPFPKKSFLVKESIKMCVFPHPSASNDPIVRLQLLKIFNNRFTTLHCITSMHYKVQKQPTRTKPEKEFSRLVDEDSDETLSFERDSGSDISDSEL